MSKPEKLYKKHNHWAFSPNSYSENDDIYILKAIANEELMQVMGDGAGVYIDRQIKETVEEILQPIVDEYSLDYSGNEYGCSQGSAIRYKDTVIKLRQAIKETIKRFELTKMK